MGPRLSPVSRRELSRRFHQLGFRGPFSGSKHSLMIRETVTVRVPNPHGSDITVGLLSRLLKQAGVSVHEWLGPKLSGSAG